MRVSRYAATFFPLAASYRFCGDLEGLAKSKWSSARPEHERAVQEGEERKRKRKRENCWKSGGGDECVIMAGEGRAGR
jgi:hypothetical protein